MKVRQAHLALLVSLSVVLAASTAAAQVRLHAPGQRQGYIVTESGSVKVRPYSANTQAIGWQLGMAPGGGATYDLRHVTGPNPSLRFSATAADSAAATTEPLFPTYGVGVDAELKKPGGPLDPSTFFFQEHGLNAVRTAGNRYILAFVADGKPAATVVEFEGASDGSRLTAGSARLEAMTGSTATNQLVGPGFNGKYVVIGGASKTSIIGYSNGIGGGVVAQVDNPTGYQYLSSGPAVGNPDQLWVVAVRTSDRTVKLFPLLPTGYRPENEAIDAQLTLMAGVAGDKLVPAFDGAGKCFLVTYRGTSGPFSKKTSVRVVNLETKALVAGATRDDGPDFSQAALPPPVAATATGAYLVGKAIADPSVALYSVSTTSGTLSKVTLTGGSFGTDEPTSLLAEAPPAPPTTSLSDATPVAAGQPAVFTVSRSAQSTDAVTVTYQTVDGTALAGTDYTPPSGSVVFEPGAVTKTVSVSTLVPSTCKAERTFKARLTGTFATSSPKAEGVATILADQGCATAVVSGGGGVCRGGSATLTATFAGTGPWIVTWSDGVQATYTTSPATRTVSPQTTTTYTITNLTSQGKQGASSGSATVTVADASQTPRITLKDTLSPSEQATASVTGEDTLAFTWEAQENGAAAPGVILGGQGTNKATIRPTKAGILTLKATRTGAGCGGSTEVKIAVAAASSPRLLLENGRVSVQVAWRHAYAPGTGGIADSVPDAAAKETLGSFHFGDASNPELFVKILDFTDTFPVFYGGLTDFEYLVTFRVEATGETVRFAKAAFDTTQAGGTKLRQPGSRWQGSVFSEEEARAALADGVTYLQLSKERILVGVTYRNPYLPPPPPALASATPLSKGDGFGYFYIDGPGNPELFVKALDRTEEEPNKSYALFYTGLTDFEYEATFVNAQTGQILTFSKAGKTFAGGVSGDLQFAREKIPNAATAVPEIQVKLGDGSLAPRDAKGYWQVNALVPVTFSAPTASSGPIWDFGDGTASTSATPSHTFSASGLVVVQVRAGSGRSAAILRLGGCPTISVSPSSLPDGTIGQAYQQTLTASGGAAPYSYTVTTGTLPPGLAVNGAAISGTPTAQGSYTFTVTARDANGCTGSQPYRIEISGAPASCANVTIQIAPDQLPEGVAGTQYSQPLDASGGKGPYEYSIVGQPPGLFLVNGSILRWTDPIAGTYGFSIEARDATFCKGTKAYTLTVTPQQIPTCTTFPISPMSASPNDQAGSVPVSVTGTAPSGCAGGNWTAAGSGFVTVSPTSGTGSGSVTVSWTQNTSSSARTATASIAGSTFTVRQSGTGVNCVMRGDVDCSESVDSNDLTLLREYIVNRPILPVGVTEASIVNGDVNTCPRAARNKENITVTDVVVLRSYIENQVWPVSCAD